MKKYGTYLLMLAASFAIVVGITMTKGFTTTGVLLFALFLFALTAYRVMALGIEAKDAKGNRIVMLAALVIFYAVRYSGLEEREVHIALAVGLALYFLYDALRVYRILKSKGEI